jgi:hypothetical protein
MRIDPTILIVLGILLAGCTANPAHEGPQSADAPAHGSPGQDLTGNPSAPGNGPFTASYTLGCKQVRFFLPIPLDHAQSLLPAGWTAADSGSMTSLAQPGAAGLPTGQGLFFYDVAKCPASTINGSASGTEFANVAILVQSPRLPGVPPFAPVNIEIYDLELYSNSDPAWASIFEATEWGSRMADVSFSLEFGPAAGGGPSHAAIDVAGTPIASLDWIASPATQYGPILARFWHQGANGTVTGGIELTSEEYGFGTVTSCKHTAGSKFALAIGQTDCNGIAPLIVTGLATNGRNGMVTWLPGIFAEA